MLGNVKKDGCIRTGHPNSLYNIVAHATPHWITYISRLIVKKDHLGIVDTTGFSQASEMGGFCAWKDLHELVALKIFDNIECGLQIARLSGGACARSGGYAGTGAVKAIENGSHLREEGDTLSTTVICDVLVLGVSAEGPSAGHVHVRLPEGVVNVEDKELRYRTVRKNSAHLAHFLW
jgi:hypothetical protein